MNFPDGAGLHRLNLRSGDKEMKKLFLMGRSEAGKTSLTQILSGEELHYHKTQYTTRDGHH